MRMTNRYLIAHGRGTTIVANSTRAPAPRSEYEIIAQEPWTEGFTTSSIRHSTSALKLRDA